MLKTIKSSLSLDHIIVQGAAVELSLLKVRFVEKYFLTFSFPVIRFFDIFGITNTSTINLIKTQNSNQNQKWKLHHIKFREINC